MTVRSPPSEVFLSETQPPAYAGSSLGPFLEPHGLGRCGEPVHMNMELQLQLLPRGMKSSAFGPGVFCLVTLPLAREPFVSWQHLWKSYIACKQGKLLGPAQFLSGLGLWFADFPITISNYTEPGGSVVKESSRLCRRLGFNPWSEKIPHAEEQRSPYTTTEPVLEPVSRNNWACVPSLCAPEPVRCDEKAPHWEAYTLQPEPTRHSQRNSLSSSGRPTQPEMNEQIELF